MCVSQAAVQEAKSVPIWLTPVMNAPAGNMMLFGPDGLIKRYETPQDILTEFFAVRMHFYQKRHAFLIAVRSPSTCAFDQDLIMNTKWVWHLLQPQQQALSLVCTRLQAAEFEQMRCNNKMRFILAVVAGKLKISNRKRSDIEDQLLNEGYDKMPNKGAMVSSTCLCSTGINKAVLQSYTVHVLHATWHCQLQHRRDFTLHEMGCSMCGHLCTC